MKDKEFRAALTAAVAGDHDDLELILRLYAPLIDRYSIVDGRLDEDLRQYIMITAPLRHFVTPLPGAGRGKFSVEF